MTKTEFLASVSASIASIGSSLSTIATAIQNHPATGDSDFDSDGTLANAATQLQTLASQAKSAADLLNPATPGGVSDPALTPDPTPVPAPSDTTGGDTTVNQTVTSSDTGGDSTAASTPPPSDAGEDSGVSGQSLGDAGLAPSSDTGGDVPPPQ